MLDINKTLDVVKLRFYNEWLYTAHLYDEGDSAMHEKLTAQVAEHYITPLNLPKDARIVDLGSGPGYFLDYLKANEYTNYVGVGLGAKDNALCRSKGHPIKEYDISFLPQSDGFTDESVDLVFLRHALEHSPYPIISLVEYNRILKLGGYMYVEVPAPDCERRHEFNLNHYSILGSTQLQALLHRTGFETVKFDTLEFTINVNVPDSDEPKTVTEKYYTILCKKKKPLDIK